MNERLTLQDLVDLLAERQDLTKKDAELFLRELIALISETIEENEPVKVKDFGTFKLVKVNARKSIDVNTGEDIEIAAHYKLSFAPDKSLRETINKPFAHFESVILEDGVIFEDEEIKTDSIANETKAQLIASDSVDEDIIDEIEVDVVEKDVEESDKEESSAREFETIQKTSELIENDINISEMEEKVNPEEIKDDNIENQQEQLSEEQNQEEVYGSNSAVQEDVLDSDSEQQSTKEDDDDELPPPPPPSSDKTTYLYAALIILGILLLIFGGKYFYNNKQLSNRKTVTITTPKEPSLTGLEMDSLANSKDTLAITPEAKLNVVENKEAKPLGTEVLKQGETLRLISLKYYGHKIFWVYIYKENQDKIKNPNVVSIGTKLTIPSLSKYNVDPKDKKEVEKAYRLESEIIHGK